MTGLENLELFACLKCVDKKRIHAIIEFMNLSEKDLKKKVQTYSLGMKQKLGIGITLLSKPEFLMLDEPANGLDPSAKIELRKSLKALAEYEKTAILISSHTLDEIVKLTDRIICINQGKIIQVPLFSNQNKAYEVCLNGEISVEEYLKQDFIESVTKIKNKDLIVLKDLNRLTDLFRFIINERHCKIIDITKYKMEIEKFYKDMYGETV